MKRISEENNFAYLCVALITLLFSAALVDDFPTAWGENFFSLVSILMLMVSIKSLNTEIAWRKIVYVLIALQIILTVIGNYFVIPAMKYLVLLLLLFFFIGSFHAVYKQIFFQGKIDRNKIIGSISLYILLGLVWAIIYLFLIQLDPHAFSGIESAGGSWQNDFSRVAYYSFVTLTTLGYGDVLPISHLAQFFVSMEAVIGVFYMAIIVSSLVSLGISRINDKD